MNMISNSAVRRGFPTQLFIQWDNIPPLKILFSKKPFESEEWLALNRKKKKAKYKTKYRKLSKFCFERCDTYLSSFSKLALSIFSGIDIENEKADKRLPGWSLQSNEITHTHTDTKMFLIFRYTCIIIIFFLTLTWKCF